MRRKPIWRRNPLAYSLAVLLGVLAAVLFAPVPTNAQHPQAWRYLDHQPVFPPPFPPLAEAYNGGVGINVATLPYTRYLYDSGGIYREYRGQCEVYKQSTHRTVVAWDEDYLYGDVYVECPPDEGGERPIEPSCSWAGNFRGSSHPSSPNFGADFLGNAHGSTQYGGNTDCYAHSYARTAGSGFNPQATVYESQATVEFRIEPTYPGRVEFGTRIPGGMVAPPGNQFAGDNFLVHYETHQNLVQPAFSSNYGNYARMSIYDETAYTPATAVTWCQEPCQPPPSPPLSPEVWQYAREDSTPVAAGKPADSVITTARRRAETFWRDRGRLSSCMDSWPIRWVADTEEFSYTDNNGRVLTTTMRREADRVDRPIAYALAFGCNTKNYSSPPKGHVQNPALVFNRRAGWTVRKLCVNLAHELGHGDRASQAYGFTHQDTGGFDIMLDDPTNTVGVEWGPCQSG